MRTYTRLPVESRFWSKVDPGSPDSCWDWKGARTRDGYGRLGSIPKSPNGPEVPEVRAHRLSWELANGRVVPEGHVVCHRCDRPICVNPSHLFLGTPGDNNTDRNTKGRSGSLAGASNPSAKLTPEQVRAIRSAYARGGVTQTALAEQYGVKQAQVSRIVRGASYRA